MSWLLAVLLSCQVGAPAPDCIIVEFASENCGPCKQLQPALEQLKREGWVVRTVDVEREPLLVRKFAVESLPTLVLVSKGKEVDRIVGAAPYEKILPRLAKLLLSSNPSAIDSIAAVSAPKAIPAQAAPTARTTPSSVAENWQAASRTQQPSSPQTNAQPELTVRGQSPSSGAFPMLAAASPSLANAPSSQSVADRFNSLSSSAPTVSAPTSSMPASSASVNSPSFSSAAQALPKISNASAVAPASAVGPAMLSSASAMNPAARPIAAPIQPALSRSAPVDLQKAIARAEAATVRIRVDEQSSTAYGTGTVIDVHGDEALVLTCGHLFREMKPHSQLTIDLFAGRAQPVNIPAQLIDFQATPGEEDVGLLSFRLPFAIEAVPLLPQAETLAIGQPAFSFGCDHGENPTRRDTNVKNINRYLGAPNVEISGAPAVGRSGGGLFDQQGRLIGVCNAADAAGDEGIYAAAGIVYTQLDRLKLSHLFSDVAATQPVPTPRAPVQLASGPAGMPSQPEFNARAAEPSAIGGNQPLANATSPAAPQTLICIVRDAGGREQVMTVDSPTADLVQAISLQAGR